MTASDEAKPRRTLLSTGEVDRAIAAYEAGASVRAIAALLGRSYGGVWRVLDRAGVPMRSKGRRKATP